MAIIRRLEKFQADTEHLLDTMRVRGQNKNHHAIMSLKLNAAIGKNELPIANNSPETETVRDHQIAELAANQRGGFKNLRLNNFGHAIIDGIKLANPSAARFLQNPRYRGRMRRDDRIDAEAICRRDESLIIDKAQGVLTAFLLGAQRGEEIELVVAGERDNGAAAIDASLVEQIEIHAIAFKNDDVGIGFGELDGARVIVFDQVDALAVRAVNKAMGEASSDRSAANDDDMVGFGFAMAEQFEDLIDRRGLGDTIDAIAGDKLIVAGGGDQMAMPSQADDLSVELGLEFGNATQRGLDYRAIGFAFDAEHDNPTLDQLA